MFVVCSHLLHSTKNELYFSPLWKAWMEDGGVGVDMYWYVGGWELYHLELRVEMHGGGSSFVENM